MRYAVNGACWGILYAIVGWFWSYRGVLLGSLPPTDSIAYIILTNSEPGAELFTTQIIWAIIGALIGSIVWLVAAIVRKLRGKSPAVEQTPEHGIGKLVTATAIMFAMALVASWYATAQMANLRA